MSLKILISVVMYYFGKIVSKKIWENELCPNAVSEAVLMFSHYAALSPVGEQVYLRILLNLLNKRIQTAQMLELFTQAAALYAETGNL